MNLMTLPLILSSLIPGAMYGAESLVVIESEIENVRIYKHKDEDNLILLTPLEVAAMASAINSSKSVGLCKYAVNVWLIVSLKNGGVRKFRLNGNTIKENNDTCFELQDGYGSYLNAKVHSK